jgi:hypothetical protein
MILERNLNEETHQEEMIFAVKSEPPETCSTVNVIEVAQPSSPTVMPLQSGTVSTMSMPMNESLPNEELDVPIPCGTPICWIEEFMCGYPPEGRKNGYLPEGMKNRYPPAPESSRIGNNLIIGIPRDVNHSTYHLRIMDHEWLESTKMSISEKKDNIPFDRGRSKGYSEPLKIQYGRGEGMKSGGKNRREDS